MTKTYQNYFLFLRFCAAKAYSHSQAKYLPTFEEFARTENLTQKEYAQLESDLQPQFNKELN